MRHGRNLISIDFHNEMKFDPVTDFLVINIEARHIPLIPEPMTLSLLGMGIAGLASRRNRHVMM